MKRIFSVLLGLVVLCGLRAQTIDKNYIDGHIYFQLESSYPWEQIHVGDNDVVDRNDFPFLSELFQRYGVKAVLRPFHLFGNEQLLRIMEVHFDQMERADEFVAELNAMEQISFAEKVPLMRIMYRPNDPYYGTVNGRNWKWHLDMIKADSAWNIQKGMPYIKVAVVDNFVWGDHPDLQLDSANLCSVSYSYGSGYSYTVGSANPPSSISQSSTEDAYGASHGTHCAGLVGAINDNNVGVASIGGGVTVMGVSSTNAKYSEYILYGMQGVQWAAEHGANVISMSFGGTPSSAQQLLMQTCYDAGIVLLASAGNEGDEGNDIIYPAGYSTVISVASVDGDGRLSYFSQWGTGRADIASPGGFIAYSSSSGPTYPNILSTTYNPAYLLYYMGFKGTYYDGMQGTSMACPLAAGVVGLLLSADSTLTPAEVKERLQMTAIPLNSSSEHTIDGYGYINAYAALMLKYVTVSSQEIFFPKTKDCIDSVMVSASESWVLTGLPSWLSVSKTSGDSGRTKLYFTTLSDNDGNSVRTANIYLTGIGDAGTVELLVSQTNYDFIRRISPKNIGLGSDKQQRDTIGVFATVEWSLENAATWLTAEVQQVTADSSRVVLVTRSSNSWGKNRTAHLIFSSKGMTDDTVFVTQKMANFISMSAVTKTIGAYEGDTVSASIYSNVHWTISSNDTDWVQASVNGGSDTVQVVFTALQSNTTGSTRSATFQITDGSITKSITIRQPSCVGVKEREQTSAVNIYPNPAHHQLQVRFKEDVTELQVTDLLGKQIYHENVSGNEFTIDVGVYPPGIYFIRGSRNARTVAVGKFVKE